VHERDQLIDQSTSESTLPSFTDSSPLGALGDSIPL
jgi:hypothetical protein